jgi:hypothetical protein
MRKWERKREWKCGPRNAETGVEMQKLSGTINTEAGAESGVEMRSRKCGTVNAETGEESNTINAEAGVGMRSRKCGPGNVVKNSGVGVGVGVGEESGTVNAESAK